MTILDEILAHKREEVAAAKARRPLAALQREIASAPPVRDFRAALTRPDRLAIIAEIKRRAPSMKGPALDLDVARVAAAYEQHHASAVSVLTDQRYFGGSVQDLILVRRTVGIPILRKEFIIDPWQVFESRASGADAVLLIVRALSRNELADLLALTHQLGMRALVECHSEQEVASVPDEAEIIGINNRDLSTLMTDLAVTERLAPKVPTGRIVVSESGIKTGEDVRRLARLGCVHAILVGAAIVSAPKIAEKMSELLEAAHF